jgi:DNA-binding transcriptional MerR regulator
MDLQTISMVSKNFNISTRTLRYYEQISLIQSVKKDGYAYRTYDENSLIRLEQIIILRKLRIPLREIQMILQKEEAFVAIRVFKEKIKELTDEITAFSTIKSILEEFVSRLNENIDFKMRSKLLADESLLKIIDSLTLTKINFKEETTMDDLMRANEKLSKLKDVRIVFLPPATVAAIHFYCEEPELHAAKVLNEFVKASNLCELKPDLRHYGFNNPDPSPNTPEGMPDHGYEMWVTIPDNFIVPEPLTRKHFPGGLYAAQVIKMGDFHEWEWVIQWAINNETYEPNWGDPKCMSGLLEEQLNYLNNVNVQDFDPGSMQLDLLMPIKPRIKK